MVNRQCFCAQSDQVKLILLQPSAGNSSSISLKTQGEQTEEGPFILGCLSANQEDLLFLENTCKINLE